MLIQFLEGYTEELVSTIALVLNLFLLLILTSLFFSVRNFRKRWNKLNVYLGDVTRTVNSVRYGDLTKKIKNKSENLINSARILKDSRDISRAHIYIDGWSRMAS